MEMVIGFELNQILHYDSSRNVKVHPLTGMLLL